MPATHQGTLFRSTCSPLLDLATPAGTSETTQRRGLDLLKKLNAENLEARPENSELAARIESYELAYRMQTEAAEVVDLDQVDPKTRAMYGVDSPKTADFGRKCLIIRIPANGPKSLVTYFVLNHSYTSNCVRSNVIARACKSPAPANSAFCTMI